MTAVAVIHERGDEPDEQRAEVAQDLLAEVHDRRDARPHPDGVVVGEQRRVHRDVVGPRDPGEADAPEQHERAQRPTDKHREPGAEEPGDGDDGHAFHAVGQPAQRDRAERVEQARGGADEDRGSLADVERLLELGRDQLHCVEGELIEGDEQPQHDEHERAALGERLGQRDRRRLDAGQHVVGEDDLLLGAGLSLLAGRFLVEHGRRE